MQEIKFNNIEEQLNDLKMKGETIKRIIAPFSLDDLPEKQKLELCQVGKFLSLLDSPVEIIQRRESPDFIISYNGDIIGLEHERILNKKEVASIQSITKLFSDSGELFKRKYPDYKVLVNFWLKGDNLRFKKNERLKLISEIVDYTHSLIIGDLSINKPAYIEDVLIGKSKDISFHYNSGVSYTEYLSIEDLTEAISKKESLIAQYKANSKIDKQWLLIVIGNISPDSFEFGDYPFTVNIQSDFDKIYLMEDFNAKLYQIK